MLSEGVSWRFFAALTLIIISGVIITPPHTSPERISLNPLTLKSNLPIIRGNSLLVYANPSPLDLAKTQYLEVLVTGYSSRPEETDSDPFITASGQMVRQGIVANNALPFGTIIKLPQLFGDQTFVVQDRMNPVKSNYHIDIWFPSTKEALRFGVKKTVAEVLKNI